MKSIRLIFPHQLFKDSPLLSLKGSVYLIEETLFFNQYSFHKQKIAFHRASMKAYQEFLEQKGIPVQYIQAIDTHSDIRILISELKLKGIEHIQFIDPTDFWLEKRIIASCMNENIHFDIIESPLFLNTKNDLNSFFRKEKKKFNQTTFYIEQRKKRNILLDKDKKPIGEKWTFDTENRKKYPAKKSPPSIRFPTSDLYYLEACQYVKKYFPNNLGELNDQPLYPINFLSAKSWLEEFLEQRFFEFGPYEDAIVDDNSILHHSVLTPMLNVGLITPQEIINKCIDYSEKNNIPINSSEGFIRQIIGWREFMRGMYKVKGCYQRTHNFWGFKRKIPASFYDGSTGIVPIDTTIKKVLKTGYCHHIERLMILGNFMLLCEFDPDEVYQWFMELFIDAYDWVMVPNIYGMSQFADGGLLASKPYISGSNYLMKMSNYKKGDWQATWDGLFWRFMNKHRDVFKKNPRLSMLISMYDKMPEEKKKTHTSNAQNYLSSIS